MGWSDCGKDTEGRPIGYAFEAICDESKCEKKIHRGLAYACGGMHGDGKYDCEKYFCEEHLHYCEAAEGLSVCAECWKRNELEKEKK